MRYLTGLLDPRGRVNRRTYWLGLSFLAALQGAIVYGLTAVPQGLIDKLLGGLPALGVDPMVVFSSLVPVWAGAAAPTLLASKATPSTLLAVVLFGLIVGARLYPLAVLALKRGRDTGLGARPVTGLSLATLAIDGLCWAWYANLRAKPYDVEMGLALPAMLNIVLVSILWAVALTWLGARRSASPQEPPKG